MNITFRQLRLFLALADTGSVSAAARALHVTQPTASMQLREIAQSVGLPVYELIARKVHLTPIGHELAATARAMVQHWDGFEQQVDALKGLRRGKLRVAAVSTAKYFIPRWVGQFCQQHPGIDVSLEILNRDGVVQRLRDHMDDLYIMSQPPADMDLRDDILMPNPIVLIASEGDAASQRKHLKLRDLEGQRFILREKGSGTRMAADAHFRSQRFRPDVRLELGSNEAVKESVAAGLGLGVISLQALTGSGQGQGVRVLDVSGFPLPSAWHVVHHSGQKLSPLAAAFKTHLLRAKPKKARRPAD
jgi:DNA-binding transcriptional LysR family regulator